MDRKVSAAQTTEKTFSMKGEQHQIDEAKRLIQDKINLELELTHVGSQTVPANQGYGGGAGGQNAYQQAWGGYAQQSWDPQQAAAAQIVANVQQAGQPDYSQQWIDYYKCVSHRIFARTSKNNNFFFVL
jgi:far upstream element-binding protein